MIVVDADSKDLRDGLSCPPAAFLEADFVRAAAAKVGAAGALMYNVVCRSPERLQAATAAIQAVLPALCDVDAAVSSLSLLANGAQILCKAGGGSQLHLHGHGRTARRPCSARRGVRRCRRARAADATELRFENSIGKEKWAQDLGLGRLCRQAAGLPAPAAGAAAADAPTPTAPPAAGGGKGKGGGGGKKKRR